MMTVQKQLIKNCELVVIAVEPSRNPPVRYRGRVWVKIGPTVQQALEEEERRLAEKRRASDLPFDLRPVVEGFMEDLDAEYFRSEYLPQGCSTGCIKAK